MLIIFQQYRRLSNKACDKKRKKELYPSVVVPPTFIRSPNDNFLRVSRQSSLSDDKGDNEVKLGAVNLLVFTLRLRKTSARRPSDVSCETSHRHKWGILPPNEIISIAQHALKEGKKERKGSV